jgi:hypothetical protein
MTIRDLLGFKIFLQMFDGTASYFILTSGKGGVNPLVGAAIEAWGVLCALIFWKVFACAMLAMIYWLGLYRPTLSLGSLRFVGVVYSALCFTLAPNLFDLV